MSLHPPLPRPTIALHWIVAFGFLAVLLLGLYIENTEARGLVGLHKSVGLMLLLPVVGRLLWRMAKRFPEYRNNRRVEHMLSRITHYGLLALTLLMPITGLLMSIGDGRGLALFGLQLIARNPDPADPAKVIALNETLAAAGHAAHHFGGKAALILLALHLAGALKHHFVEKDQVLRRMMGRT